MIPRYVRLLTLLGAATLMTLTVAGCPGFPCPTCPEPNCVDCPEPNCPDCPEPNTPEPNAPEKALHERIFTEILDNPDYNGTQTCLNCHSDHALDILETAHWNWNGPVKNIAGLENESHGKLDLLNNF